MAAWTVANIPDQTGKIVIVTGASSGIGEEAASVLAGRGARVVLAVRDAGRGEAARRRIEARHGTVSLEVSLLDLADLESVRTFASRIDEVLPRVDVLLNNAGLGMQPKRGVTAQGFERMFGTNHLGHFALTGLLVPALLRAEAPRVVTIASLAHRGAAIDWSDLQGERAYRPGKAYGQSKLANMMFAFELDRRAKAAGSRLMSIAAHPGVSTTGFMAATAMSPAFVTLANFGIGLLGQNAAAGALPGLYAATMPDARGGQYWGPDGFREIRGTPKLARVSSPALDRGSWTRLWTVSEELTGVRFPALA